MKTMLRFFFIIVIAISCSMCSFGTNKITANDYNMEDSNTSTMNTKSLIIDLPYKNISLAKDEKYQLYVYNDKGINLTNDVVWVSTNPDIVSVNSYGVVTIRLNQGFAKVYATYNNINSNYIIFSAGRVIFATEALYDGDLVSFVKSNNINVGDGIQAADYLCNIDKNKPEFGKFKALIIDSNNPENLMNVIDNSKNINYVNKDGSIIGVSSITKPIDFIGQFKNNNIYESSIVLNWTGSNPGINCNNWTNNTDIMGSVGFGDNANSWDDDQSLELIKNSIWSHLNMSCKNKNSLICVQQ